MNKEIIREIMIKNIVFDIGNVLTAFQWEYKFKQHDYPNEILERVAKATVLSDTWKEYDRGVLSQKELMENFVRRDPELESVIRECAGNYINMLRKYDYTTPWIRELKQKGYRVFYLSNMPEIAERDCAEALDFIQETDGGILSWSVKLIKPDKAIYELLLKRYSLKAEECVFLDDSEKNVEAAREVGMQGIVFRDKLQASQELCKLDKVVKFV